MNEWGEETGRNPLKIITENCAPKYTLEIESGISEKDIYVEEGLYFIAYEDIETTYYAYSVNWEFIQLPGITGNEYESFKESDASLQPSSSAGAIYVNDNMNHIKVSGAIYSHSRYASLDIENTIDNKGNSPFIYKIRYEKRHEGRIETEEKIVFLNPSSSGINRKRVEQIPAGSKVTIQQVYTGTSYNLNSSEEVTINEILADGPIAKASFNNSYKDTKIISAAGILDFGLDEDGNFGYSEEITDNNLLMECRNRTIHCTYSLNEPEDEPKFVRLKAFLPSEHGITFSDSYGKWLLDSDGWWNYVDILNNGETTQGLHLLIDFGDIDGDDPNIDFNVGVVVELAPVLYDESGNPYAD